MSLTTAGRARSGLSRMDARDGFARSSDRYREMAASSWLSRRSPPLGLAAAESRVAHLGSMVSLRLCFTPGAAVWVDTAGEATNRQSAQSLGSRANHVSGRAARKVRRHTRAGLPACGAMKSGTRRVEAALGTWNRHRRRRGPAPSPTVSCPEWRVRCVRPAVARAV